MAHHDRGRPTSWLAAIVIMAGFLVGGLGLVLAHWWLFWVGIGICVVGGIIAIAVDMVSDVELDPIHQDNAEPFKSLVRHTVVDGTAEQLTPRLIGEGPDIGSLDDEGDEADDQDTAEGKDAASAAGSTDSEETSSSRS